MAQGALVRRFYTYWATRILPSKRSLLVGLLWVSFFLPTVAFSATVQQCHNIYYKLVTTNQIKLPPRLVFTNNPKVYAETDGLFIYLNPKKLPNSSDELALILGHELGHRKAWAFTSHSREYKADRFGAQYMKQAGYNLEKGKKILKTFGKATKSHPAGLDRLKQLSRY